MGRLDRYSVEMSLRAASRDPRRVSEGRSKSPADSEDHRGADRQAHRLLGPAWRKGS